MSILSDWFYTELENVRRKFATQADVVFVAGGRVRAIDDSLAIAREGNNI